VHLTCGKKSGLLNYRIAIDLLRPKFVGSSSSSLEDSMLTPRGLLRIATPPYFFQPLQILKRLRLEYLWRSKNEAIVTLPWGLLIKIDPHEAVGYDIASQGLYEIDVTETLWRLTEPGDLAIDAGANIGYTTSILGVRVGPKGRVHSFEPHHQVFESLRENVEIWKRDRRCGSFVLHQAALGRETGKALLHTNDGFRTNRGTAWISENVEASPDVRVIEVPIRNLDSLLGEDETIGVLKMDVQGHELGVLQGMARLLQRRAVRDIVFEEEATFPAPTHEYLKSHGYSIFGLQRTFAGVRSLPDAQPAVDPESGPVPNYLATRDPERALARLTPAMWRSFGPGRLLGSR
jgi:FkbM family methyltransferase